MKLNEGASSEVYHFSNLYGAVQIFENDRMDMSDALTTSEIKFQKEKYPFFLSTTQNKHPDYGFQSSITYPKVRFTLDAVKLSHIGKFSRIDFFKYSKTYKSTFEKQNEDRFLTFEPFIPNFHKYLTEIEIYIQKIPEYKNEYKTLEKLLVRIKNFSTQFNVPFNIIYPKSKIKYKTEVPDFENVSLRNCIYDSDYTLISKLKGTIPNEQWNKLMIQAKKICPAFEESKINGTGKYYGQPIGLVGKIFIKPLAIKFMKEGKTVKDLLDFIRLPNKY